jgi:hypothetical protein
LAISNGLLLLLLLLLLRAGGGGYGRAQQRGPHMRCASI